jgi:hypothetical protein
MTVQVANVGPADWNYDETMSTLRYANRAKMIKNKPVVNEDPKDAMLRDVQSQIAQLKEQLAMRKQVRFENLPFSPLPRIVDFVVDAVLHYCCPSLCMARVPRAAEISDAMLLEVQSQMKEELCGSGCEQRAPLSHFVFQSMGHVSQPVAMILLQHVSRLFLLHSEALNASVGAQRARAK